MKTVEATKPGQAMTQREQELVALLRRLLRLCDIKQTRIDQLEELLARLNDTCCQLQGRLEAVEQAHAAADYLLGTAMDDLLDQAA